MIGFVTGLPRSRSAWFATLLTWGDSIWKHDALCDGGQCGRDSLGRLEDWLICAPHKHKGHSDASNILVWRELDKCFPDAKWVVIEREYEDTLISCQSVLPSVTDAGLTKMYLELEDLKCFLSPIVIPFNEITPAKCYEIAEYLGIDIGPATRVRQLCDMNIQIHPPILKKRLASLQKSKPMVYTEKAA